MISKDELILSVAQSCGVSKEIASYFFEVFVNRLSNKLKPGDLLHYHSLGYFHKRNCRIQIEKTADSPTPKSYLIQLILFSSEMKLKNDLSDIHFLKIANLKTLWIDDKEFEKSLKSGDFAPYDERNQLIKSFATKAEVIISSLRLDYDSELVEELIFPSTFDLKFLIKPSQKTNVKKETPSIPKKNEIIDTRDKEKIKESGNDGLPWNYGTKFLDKTKTGAPTINKTKPEFDEQESAVGDKDVTGNVPNIVAKDFQQVKPHLETQREYETVKYTVSKTTGEQTEVSESSNKFTEVKSKTESYRKKDKSRKKKDDRFNKYSSLKYSNQKAFTDRKNFLPIVAIIAFIIISLFIVYIYFIKSGPEPKQKENAVTNIQPPPNLNVIDRDYNIIVSYPYPKLGIRIDMGGFSKNVFEAPELKSESIKEPKNEIKTVSTVAETKKNNEGPPEEKTVKPLEEKKKNDVESKNDENRIFLYKNFYVVYVGTYSTEETANRVADKYFNLGYNAMVENLETREGNQEYKLIVGDFTSEDFAKQFLEKYIK